jgi:hypothetical protein
LKTLIEENAEAESTPAPSRYKMTIGLKVLDHLGINLYSNVAAVLTEAVANAWDADAEEIHIDFDENMDEITITDDGHGMTVDDMNSKYLFVGYQRREDDSLGDKSLIKKRPVMGRKGLGKLSLFSIANTIEIQSAKDGEKHGLTMSAKKIKNAIEIDNTDYFPDELPDAGVVVTKGTIIKLNDLKKGRLGRTKAALKERLARRFTVLATDDFHVYINNMEITPLDRGDLRTVEFLWNISRDSNYHEDHANVKEHTSLPEKLGGWEDPTWQVRGWIGTAPTPKALATDSGNLNSIVIMARGRLFQENILDAINDGRHYTHYLTGQIEADFLDTGEEDIATSDRQRVMEDDDRYQAIISYLKSALSKIEPQWNKWREKHKIEEIVKEHPAVAAWFEELQEGWRDQAKKVIATITKFEPDDEEDKKEILKNSILAFERLKLKGYAHEFASALNAGPEKLINLLSGLDEIEAIIYRDIVKSRLEVIKAFTGLVDDDAKEMVLQKHLFDHLWLLDPSWENVSGSERMETKLREEGVIVDDLTKKEELGRVDIAYRTHAGKHIIVELKRAGRKLDVMELVQQGRKYVTKLKKILSALNQKSPDIEVIFVIGKALDEESNDPDSVKHLMNGVSPGSRIKHYDELIEGARRSYSEYLESTKDLTRISRVVDNI